MATDEVGTPAWGEAVRDACGVGLLVDMQGRPSAGLLPRALGALARMAHRGAVDADGRTGDGAGVTTQIPFAVLRAEVEALGLPCREGAIAVGLIFLPVDRAARAAARALVEAVLVEHDLSGTRWRAVPVDERALGDKARRSRPTIAHVLVPRPDELAPDAFEAVLVAARRRIEMRATEAGLHGLYIASLSHRTLVYKALVRAVDLAGCYPDLRNPAYETAFALFHQRFSTNTAPSWSMTQPFRLVAHNGEINTIEGNRRWMDARAPQLDSFPIGHERLGAAPARPGTSDSATFDEALATLTAAGRSLLHGLTLLMPPAWENDAELSPQMRSFLDYQASVMEPWDGPAMMVFTDGRVVGAALDRNGLRPARYLVTTGGLVLVSSEVGVLDVDESEVVVRGRLGPGDLIAVDLESHRILDRESVHESLAARRPYARWLSEGRVPLARLRTGLQRDEGARPAPASAGVDVAALRAMGVTREELLLILGPMYKEGIEPLGSMGDDSPLAVLSASHRPLFSYFRQRFAQVTNPAIDSLRETLVMSLDVRLGPAPALLTEGPLPGPQVHLADPILEPGDVDALLAWPRAGWRACRYDLSFSAAAGTAGFAWALDSLCARTKAAARAGVSCLVLSDSDVNARHATLPTLLAVGAVHNHLVRSGLRMRTSIVVDAGDARDEHAIAALLAFGADAVCPRVAYGAIEYASRQGPAGEQDLTDGVARYRRTLIKGLLKILAKMGVSTVRSYRGAGLFEAIGLADDVIAEHFTGTPSAVGGIDMSQIAAETLACHRAAYASSATLEEGGWHRYRKDGEPHAFEPAVVKALHTAIRSRTKLDYRAYADLVHARAPLALRDLVDFRAATPIPIDEVEPATAILPRFISAAMSLGALSPEAQQTIATAMNRLGARSNSGEGGEPPELFWRCPVDTVPASARIKQVASGRFGVTAAYLMSADELQIKMAQGSKPGEGGQLPGAKVVPHIARVRHAAVGTTLISPPPHHDIYSIEDLAQLVYDLKRVNPAATVSVKLVSSAGIGTIAVGVAKAHADAIQISGHDGGTGASPRGSIKNAGTPWELGLSEVHQALVRGGLRGRVRLQVDGGLKTGRDVVLAALLGAEEFGFGTAALVAAGCVMARQCHVNSCPAGIATQREELRKKFTGTPEDVERFFVAIAEEVREILALLGVRRLADVVGHTELAERRAPAGGKAARVRLDRVLAPRKGDGTLRCAQPRNDPPVTGTGIDERALSDLRMRDGRITPVELILPITNADRSVGARVAGQLVVMTHAGPVPPRTVQLFLRGSAGQSFGAFCVDGMRLVLDGEANDYVGKGMSGGEIVVRPPAGARHDGRQVIAGNTILYGATGGTALFAGRVGERFGVRNSGAVAVVEGTGDHAGEYMTAGGILILGPTGRNVGAGMTGGVLFAFDGDGSLARRTHRDWVDGGTALTSTEDLWVRDLLARHAQATYSRVAEQLLNSWEGARHLFRRVSPLSVTDGSRPLPMLAPDVARTDARQTAGRAGPMRAVSGAGARGGAGMPVPSSAETPP
jgi:glutamate synthase (ferredoxin)